jgi:Mg-chelatase subunit ChlD
VAVDQSQSMSIGKRSAMALRTLQSLQAQAANLPDLEMRVVDIPAASQNGTPLFAALRDAMSDTPALQRAGLIVITDGEISDAPAAMPAGAPLSALLTANGEETDRELRPGRPDRAAQLHGHRPWRR